MKKLIFVFLSLFIFSTIILPKPSLGATQQKKASVKSSKKKVVKQKKRAMVRYSHNINNPQEGNLLKLEGMVKDLNEQ